LSGEVADLDHLAAAIKKSFVTSFQKVNIFISYKRDQHAVPAAELQ